VATSSLVVFRSNQILQVSLSFHHLTLSSPILYQVIDDYMMQKSEYKDSFQPCNDAESMPNQKPSTSFQTGIPNSNVFLFPGLTYSVTFGWRCFLSTFECRRSTYSINFDFECLLVKLSRVIDIMRWKAPKTLKRSIRNQMRKKNSFDNSSLSRIYDVEQESISPSRTRYSSWSSPLVHFCSILLFIRCIHPLMASESGEWYQECIDGTCGHGGVTKSSSSSTCRDSNEQCGKFASMGTCDCLMRWVLTMMYILCHDEMQALTSLHSFTYGVRGVLRESRLDAHLL
jgi:hypothetical protein